MQADIMQAGSRRVPQFASEPWVLVPAATGSTDKSQLRQRYEQPLLVLVCVAACVLLLACANITHLLLARAADRRHEFGVRLALGATRMRLVRQLLIESLALAGAGAAMGVLIAVWMSRLLVSQLSPTGLPVFLPMGLDARMLGFSLAASVLTVVLFGLAPARVAARTPATQAIRSDGRTAGGTGGWLVAAQVSLSAVLVIAAGWFGATFGSLDRTPLGYDADRILVFSVDSARFRDVPDDRVRAIDRLVAAVATSPGIERVAASVATPGPGGGANLPSDARGRRVDLGPRVFRNAVLPGWFAAYGVPVHAGRDVSATDTAAAPAVAVVNDAYVKRSSDPARVLGTSIEDADAAGGRRTIVGIVGDVVYGSARDTAVPTVYLPLPQAADLGPMSAGSTIQISVRRRGDSGARAPQAIGRAIAAFDPDASFTVRDAGDRVRASLAQERLLAVLSGFFALLAAFLAGLGIYGVTAHDVRRRNVEFGIRLALGGSPAAVGRLVLLRAARLAGAGLAIGLGASLLLSRFVASLLYGLEPGDPLVIAGALAFMTVVAAIGAWRPTRRAMRVNPAQLLRRT
jgi:predicted permease